VQLSFADEPVRLLCTTQESLMQVFGELWASVKFCLTVLAAAEALADVATFAAITVRVARRVSQDVAEFLILCGPVQMLVRAVGVDVPEERTGPMTAIKAVTVLSVMPVAAAAVGS
jgi:hypothetical protein